MAIAADLDPQRDCMAGAAPGPVSPDLTPGMDSTIVNAFAVTDASERLAARGMATRRLICVPEGSWLFRIGSSKRRGVPMPVDSAYASAWWMTRGDLDRILSEGQQDTRWSARVLLAIAGEWQTLCDLQVSVRTRRALYAWRGSGRSMTRQGQAVDDADPTAHWMPRLPQIFVPGLDALGPDGDRLWRSVFLAKTVVPILPIGTQTHLPTGRPFVPSSQRKSTLPPRRGGG